MAETKNAVFKVTIKASIQDVWDALTKEGEPLPFFFNSVMHSNGLKPGSRIRMRTPNGKYTGVVGEILEFAPPHKFSHTFKFTHLDDPDAKITYELEEVEGGVAFTLTSENIPVGTKSEGYMIQGGDFITKTLKGMFENGKPPFKSRFILLMCGLTQFMTPKKSLSTNWPL